MSGRLADGMEATGARRLGDASRLAGWLLDADRAPDPGLLLRGDEEAHRAMDFAAALRLAGAAWGATRRADAGHLFGHVLWLVGRHDEAVAVLTEALAVTTDEDAIVHLANTLASTLLRGRHDAVGSDAVHLAARRRTADPDRRAHLECHHAALLVLQGRVDEAWGWAAPHLDGPPRTLVAAAAAAAPAAALGGRTSEGIAISERALEVHGQVERLPFAEDDAGIHFLTLAAAQLHAGRLDEAAALAAACYDATVAARSMHGRAWFAEVSGHGALSSGALSIAARWFAESADAFDQAGDVGMQRVALADLALATACMGDGERAVAALVGVERLDRVAVRLYDTTAVRARAWLAAAVGDLEEVGALLVGAIDDDLACGRVTLAVGAVHDLARLGRAQEAVAQADRLPPVDGRLLPVQLDHVRALAAGDPDHLVTVADRFEACGARLFAGEAAAAAADLRRRAGEGRRATALARRAAALAAGSEAASPVLADLDSAGARLTEREAQLVRLAAGGASNPDIAERLGLSVRTVENHLGRAYAKLGVSGREELRRRPE